jgi:hypothetical protein
VNNTLSDVFGFLPDTLKAELLNEYNKIANGYFEGNWEPSELGGGKFCEIVYSILDGYTNGIYPNNATKPRSMEKSCQDLANRAALPDSLRLSVPRALIFLYDVRNKRGVGHVSGGNIDPNHMDSLVVFNMVKWIMAELIRVLHSIDSDTARNAVETLTTRSVPLVWEYGNTKRVLEKMDAKSQMLVLLYSYNTPVSVANLISSIEYSNASVFRSKIINPCHKDRIVEFNKSNDTVLLTPNGIVVAENMIKSYK